MKSTSHTTFNFAVKIFDHKISENKTNTQSLHRAGALYAGHNIKESKSRRDHHCHRGGLRETEGIVKGDDRNPPAGRELLGTENVTPSGRTIDGGPDVRRAAGTEQRDLLRT